MKKIALASLTTITMSGCGSLGAFSSDPATLPSWPVTVQVVKKESFSKMIGSGFNNITNTLYEVKDAKGRTSVVVSQNDSFKIGQCATLWRANVPPDQRRTYPRLSASGENCSPLKTEPAGIGGYTYMRKFNTTYQLYDFSLDTWLDLPEDELIEKWGAPEKSYNSGGKRYLTYSKQHSKVYGYGDYYNGVNINSKQFSCETTFIIKNGNIQGYQWQGNNCY